MSKEKKAAYSSKKAAVLQENKSGMNPVAIVIVAAVVVAIGGVAFYLTSTPTPNAGSVAAVQTGGSDVSYPVSMFADGKARHFDYKADGLTIRYFILKSSDGVLRAAFDACDVCWPAGKGYYQEGDDMVCRNCGRRFASILVNEVKGGCNPAPLNRNVQGNQLVLKAEDILQGKTYFNFKEKA